MKWQRWLALFVLLLMGHAVHAGKMTWDTGKFFKAPAMTPAPEYDQGDVKAIFYEGPTWQGKPTRVFAYYGIPKATNGQKLPAMVLVHGGGGTAFAQWVKIWNDRGYAAIAMDTTGCINVDGNGKRQRDAQGGPDGWGSFTQMASSTTPLANEDLWSYQATAQIILAHSLLRSLPHVDPDRTGLTGISWGGYLTCIAASVDDRFKIAIPVYGCGYMYESPLYESLLEKKSAIRERWIHSCDPSNYLPDTKANFLWINGTNDKHFSLDTFQKSRALVQPLQTAAVRLNMPHGHHSGWEPEEIYAFADQAFKGEQHTLIVVEDVSHADGVLMVRCKLDVACAKAQLLYTTSTNPAWSDRPWEQIDVQVQPQTQVVIANLPKNTSACFVNLLTSNGLLTSTPLLVLRQSQALLPATVSDIEDFENRSVGDGVPGCQVDAGMSIKVTDAAAKSGKHALVFRDTKGNRSWLPMRERWFKGKDQIESGQVHLAFDLMQDAVQSGRFYVHVRDYNGTTYVNGLEIEISDKGTVTINNQTAMPVTPGQWCHFDVQINLPDGKGQCMQTTEQGTEVYPLKTVGFSKINWVGYVAGDNKDAMTYLDNVAFSVKPMMDEKPIATQVNSAKPSAVISTVKAFEEFDDFEKSKVGQSVKQAKVAPGTSILVTDAAAQSGKHCLAFTDEKSSTNWLPMYDRWFKGSDELASGTLKLAFDLMQDVNKPGKFFIHLRDYTGTKYVNGIALELDQQGQAKLNGKPIMSITPGQWCHFEITIDLGNGSAQCEQKTQTGSQTYDLQTAGFHKLSWLGFVANDSQSAVTYLDNLLVGYQP